MHRVLRRSPPVVMDFVEGVLLALILAVAVRPCEAAPPRQSVQESTTARLLESLEERQMPDVVLWVLDRVETDPRTSAEFKKEIPYRRAAALVATSRSEADAGRRAELYDKADREIAAFLQGTREGDLAIQAYLQKGNLLIERGREKVEQSKRPGQDAKARRAEAVGFFDAAIRALEGPDRKPGVEITDVSNAEDAVLKELRGVNAQLESLRGGGEDAEEPKAGAKEGGKPAAKPKPKPRKPVSGRQLTELEDRQDALRAQLLKTRLLIAGAYYEKSRACEPKSKEWEAALTRSASLYKELYEKNRTRGAGLFARYYEGRNYVVLGKRKEAVSALADIRGLEGEGIVPGLRAKAINSSLECWLEDKQFDAFDERLNKLALVPLASDRIDADWLGMKYRAALLLQRKAEALPPADKSKRLPLLRDAKKLAMEVSKVGKDFSAEARSLLSQLGKDVPDDLDVAATFAAGMDAARAAFAVLRDGQAKLDAAKAAKDAKAIEAAGLAVAQERAKAIASLRRALSLSGPEDRDQANEARYLLTYLLYEDQRLHEAAAVGGFLLDRYPQAKGSQQAGRIAMAAWQLLQKQSVAGWADEAKVRCVEVAESMMKKWPDRPEAVDAAVIAVAAAAEARDPARIMEIVAKVPASAPRRAEVLLRAGPALWREVQEKSRLEEASRPDAQSLAAWRAQAVRAIDDGLAAVPANSAAKAVDVAAALSRAQMALEDGDAKRVAELLEHPVYGPWKVLTGGDPTFAQGPLATATATAALRYFIESQQGDKATQAMNKLEQLAGQAGGDASARLTGMYQSMGRDLQAQLESIASGPQAATPEARARAAAILSGFEKFLEGVAKDKKPSSQIWAATTYYNLGSGSGNGGAVPTKKAEGYLDRAAEIFQGLLAQGGADVAKFEPSTRLKMASIYAARGKWDEAQEQMNWILSDKKRQNTLDFQLQAAEMWQSAGEKAADKAKQAEALGQAISGYRRKTAAGEAWGWGWAVISNRLEPIAFAGSDEKALEARRKFYLARLNAVKCRMARAEALGPAGPQELQKAYDYVAFTYKMHPELGGPDTRKQFDKLLKEIEKRLNRPARGIEGLKETAAPAAG
jgi:hypothetical protein